MTAITYRALLSKFVARTPETFNSVDSYVPHRKINCTFSRLTSEQRVRAGMDSAESGLSFWHDSADVATGDCITAIGKNWQVLYCDAIEDTLGGRYYAIAKELP